MDFFLLFECHNASGCLLYKNLIWSIGLLHVVRWREIRAVAINVMLCRCPTYSLRLMMGYYVRHNSVYSSTLLFIRYVCYDVGLHFVLVMFDSRCFHVIYGNHYALKPLIPCVILVYLSWCMSDYGIFRIVYFVALL
jgi:hypothetical protein